MFCQYCAVGPMRRSVNAGLRSVLAPQARQLPGCWKVTDPGFRIDQVHGRGNVVEHQQAVRKVADVGHIQSHFAG